MINSRILAVMLSFVLVAGLGTPTFADFSSPAVSPNTIIPDPNVDVANPGPGSTFCGPLDGSTILPPLEQSFVPNANNLDSIELEIISLNLVSVSPVTVNIYEGAGSAGPLIGSTSNDDGNFGTPDGNPNPTPTNTGVVRFEFASPIPLIPGDTYTLQVAINDGTSNVSLTATGDTIPGQVEQCRGVGAFPVNDYVFATYFDPNFGMVGGEFLSLDTTALILAGLQSSAIWMLPILAGAAGTTAFYLKTRKNNKSENS